MCTLVLILWGFSPQLGIYKECYYACNNTQQRRHGFYDQAYRASPAYVCPSKFYHV